jgi:hypothetical protein
MFPALRLKPGPGAGQSLPANFLKHADEQTVLALAAVLTAVDRSELTGTDLTEWGIVSGPCFLGRLTLAGALSRYAVEGAWGVSPHFIPHRSQHAVSGTISQALKIRGPNFGTGGGPGSAAEALLAGTALLSQHDLPGVWVVVTGWTPELLPTEDGRPAAPSTCMAVALALVPSGTGTARPWLRIVSDCSPVRPIQRAQESPNVSSIEAILSTLADADTPPTTLVWQTASGTRIELGRGPLKQWKKEGQGFRHQGPLSDFTLGTRAQCGAGTENKR